MARVRLRPVSLTAAVLLVALACATLVVGEQPQSVQRRTIDLQLQRSVEKELGRCPDQPGRERDQCLMQFQVSNEQTCKGDTICMARLAAEQFCAKDDAQCMKQRDERVSRICGRNQGCLQHAQSILQRCSESKDVAQCRKQKREMLAQACHNDAACIERTQRRQKHARKLRECAGKKSCIERVYQAATLKAQMKTQCPAGEKGDDCRDELRAASLAARPPRSESDAERDAEGRFASRYRMPTHKAGPHKGKEKQPTDLSKQERSEFDAQLKKGQKVKTTLEQAQTKLAESVKKVKAVKEEAAKAQAAVAEAAKTAAAAVRQMDNSRQAFARAVGPAREAAMKTLQADQTNAEKLQAQAVDAQKQAKAKREQVRLAKEERRMAADAVYEAQADLHENGFDLLLDKVKADVKKLDKSLFAPKKHFRKEKCTIDVLANTKTGAFKKQTFEVLEYVPRPVRIMKKKESKEAKHKKESEKDSDAKIEYELAWRNFTKPPPEATGPVSIIARRELRPFALPDSDRVVPVEVEYQVAVQKMTKKVNGKEKTILKKVTPPAKAGFVYREVKRTFPVTVDGKKHLASFHVGTWSKSSIFLNKEGEARIVVKPIKSDSKPLPIKQVRSKARKVNGVMKVALLKQKPVKSAKAGGLVLKSILVDVPESSLHPKKTLGKSKTLKKMLARHGKFARKLRASKLRALKKKLRLRRRGPPKQKLEVVLEGVDNSIAAQNARREALEAVEETIEDNAKFGSISERHLKAGEKAHTEVDRVRENFYTFQDKLELKQLIKPEHRFVE